VNVDFAVTRDRLAPFCLALSRLFFILSHLYLTAHYNVFLIISITLKSFGSNITVAPITSKT
jgi:hypothetical protein